MTLDEVKTLSMKLIEEYSANSTNMTADADIRRKVIFAINSVIGEIAKIRAIEKSQSYEESPATLPSDCYTVTDVLVGGKSFGYYKQYGNELTVDTDGAFVVRYNAIPTQYTDDTAGTEVLPFADNVCNIIPYGVGKIVLMVTGQTNDATECETKYYQYLQELTPTANKVKVKVHSIWQT